MLNNDSYRDILRAYPTGVCLITAVDTDGERIGMVVGSFTSISLDPPLVGFFSDKMSKTYPKIKSTGRFCVNVLGSQQLDLCQRFASKRTDKFVGVHHGESPSGHPVFEKALAWLDCTLERIEDIGDHWLVIGRAEAFGLSSTDHPLLFHQGRFFTNAEPVS